MALHYKAYLYEGKPPNKTKEIRRFCVDSDACTSYDYLRQKVSNVFPNLGNNFALQWKDAEGDMIWFNSDEELLQALTQHTPGEVFKLFIKVASSNNQERNQEKFQQPSSRGCPFGNFNSQWFSGFPYSGAGTHPGWMPHGGGPNQHHSECGHSEQQPSPPKQDKAKDYLQTMGNAVADMLNPFGIDVDISVEHKGERTKCTGTTQTQPEDTSKPDDKPSTSAGSQEPEKDTSDEQGNLSDPEWTFVKAESEKKNSASEEMETDEDARLRIALEQLEGMGIVDNGGWLADLVKACNCDILKVIDSLQPAGGSKE